MGSKLKECARLAVVGLAAAWLLHPFATSKMYGAGDALWYANMLADYVTQLRAGVFPIFAGQTEFAFNGAVYPLRVAPMYQHLAGLLDIMTGRTLGFIALQHLTVIVCGFAGIYASYATLCRIAPERRWTAAGIAILYLSCPGVLGTVYTQDLYMTWMTVPLAPLAAYGIVRTFRTDDIASQLWLMAPLAALWWAHSPIAVWFGIVAAISQGIRLCLSRRGFAPIKRAVVGVLIFVALAQFPFVSLSELRTPGVKSTLVGTLDHTEWLVGFVRSVFPAIFAPLSDHARELSDLQLGYGLWGLLAFSILAALKMQARDLAALLACIFLLLLLLIPIPKVTESLWNHVPAAIVRITYYWPMQRFYLILAALVAAAGQIASRSFSNGKMLSAIGAIVLSGCIWSTWESRQFIRAASERTGTTESTKRIQLPENITLMDHSYGLFDQLPTHFSNGVVNPRSEFRLRSTSTGDEFAPDDGPVVVEGKLRGTVDANPGILDLDPAIRLMPGRRYTISFYFQSSQLTGILQLNGERLFREYTLPSSGESKAFGIGKGHTRKLDLWTSGRSPDIVRIRFIPQGGKLPSGDLETFAAFKLNDTTSLRVPVDVESLLPLKAVTTSKVTSILETPRYYLPGYRAMIDGIMTPTTRSPEGLLELRVPAGRHLVEIAYPGTTLLRVSYWLSILAWTTVIAFWAAWTFCTRNLSSLAQRPRGAC